jgi:hypothetical protein
MSRGSEMDLGIRKPLRVLNQNKPFDPYSFDYRSYLLERYGLSESPQRMDNRRFVLDDDLLNHQEGIRVENESKSIGDFKTGQNQSYRLFEEVAGSNTTYYLLYPDKPQIVVEYSFEKINPTIIQTKSIWNHRWYKGLARFFFEEFVLANYPSVMSDSILTESGFKFWLTLFDEMVKSKKSHGIYVVERKSEMSMKWIHSREEMEEYYGDGQSKYSFVITTIQSA